jgi:hypothetical protein
MRGNVPCLSIPKYILAPTSQDAIQSPKLVYRIHATPRTLRWYLSLILGFIDLRQGETYTSSP